MYPTLMRCAGLAVCALLVNAVENPTDAARVAGEPVAGEPVANAAATEARLAALGKATPGPSVEASDPKSHASAREPAFATAAAAPRLQHAGSWLNGVRQADTQALTTGGAATLSAEDWLAQQRAQASRALPWRALVLPGAIVLALIVAAMLRWLARGEHTVRILKTTTRRLTVVMTSGFHKRREGR